MDPPRVYAAEVPTPEEVERKRQKTQAVFDPSKVKFGALVRTAEELEAFERAQKKDEFDVSQYVMNAIVFEPKELKAMSKKK